MTDRVTHAELLAIRSELLEDIPTALRERLRDIDHLLGWPPDRDFKAENAAVEEENDLLRDVIQQKHARATELSEALKGIADEADPVSHYPRDPGPQRRCRLRVQVARARDVLAKGVE